MSAVRGQLDQDFFNPAIVPEISNFVENSYISPDEKINALKKTLKEPNGYWLSTLRGQIVTELQTVLDESDEEKRHEVKKALENLLKGELEHFTDNVELAAEMVNIQEPLVIQKLSTLFNTVVQRDFNSKKIPTIELMRLAAIDAIQQAAKDCEISLTIEPNYEKIVLEDNFIFIPAKKYNYDEMIDIVYKLFNHYGIDNSCVIRHLLIREAGITEFPSPCYFSSFLPGERRIEPIEHIKIPGHFILQLGLSFDNVNKFVKFANAQMGPNTVEKLISSFDNLYTLQLNTNAFVKKFLSLDFRNKLTEYLSSPIYLQNYRVRKEDQGIIEPSVRYTYAIVGKRYAVDAKGYLGICLLKAFQIKNHSTYFKFENAKRYDGFATDIDFFFEISNEQARQLVHNINEVFPNSSKVIDNDKEIVNEEGKSLQQIAIKYEVLMLEEFQKRIGSTLNDISKNDIDLFEAFQYQSGTLLRTTKKAAEDLNALAAEFKESNPSLESALQQFSLFVSERKPIEKLKEVSFDVEIALAEHQARFFKGNPQGYKLFKENSKKAIKELQRDLGTREETSSPSL